MATGKKRAAKGKQRGNGEGGLILRGRIWWAQYYQDGRQVRVSTQTHVKAEALTFLRKLMDSRDKGEVPVTDIRKLKYADLRQGLIDSYVAEGNKSLKERADGTENIAGLAALDAFCGFKQKADDGKIVVTDRGISAQLLTTDFASRFAKERKAEGVGNAAINRSLAALRRMLNIAKRAKKIHDVPYIQFWKEPPARKGFLEAEKFEELIALLPTHLRALVRFLYDCGTRIGEALQIEWSQVDLDARLFHLEPEQTKNSEARSPSISSELYRLLCEIEPKSGRVFDGTNLRKEWMKACTLAGLGTLTEVEGRPYDPIYSGLTLHDLRRSAVRDMVRAGNTETVVMKISGHKTRDVFDRYNITSTEDVTKASQRTEMYRLNRLNGKTLKGEVSSRKPSHGDSLVTIGGRRTRKSLMALSSRG